MTRASPESLDCRGDWVAQGDSVATGGETLYATRVLRSYIQRRKQSEFRRLKNRCRLAGGLVGLSLGCNCIREPARTMSPVPTPSLGRSHERAPLLVKGAKTQVHAVQMNLQVLATDVRTPYGKAVGDVNNDGVPDILVQSHTGQVVFFESPSGERHVIDDVGEHDEDLAVGELNGDKYSDVVILRERQLWWCKGSANAENGPWKKHLIDAEKFHDVEVADFNGDGRDDIAARDGTYGNNSNKVHVYLQPLKAADWGRVKPIVLPLATMGEGLGVGDIDNDADQDIVVNSYWLRNNGRASFERLQYAGPSWDEADTNLALGDIDGDGRLDIAVTPSEKAGGAYRISWFRAAADVRQLWEEHGIEPNIETAMHSAVLADINLDGHIDLVTAEMHQSSDADGGDRVLVYSNPGAAVLTATSWTPTVISTEGSHSLRAVDFNNDGLTDIVGANWDAKNGRNTNINLWLNQSKLSLTNWRLIEIDKSKVGKSLFFFAEDMNGDGFRDIQAGAATYTNPGPGVLDKPWPKQLTDSPARNFVYAFDADGDGDQDFLSSQGASSRANPNLTYLRNNAGPAPTVFRNIPPGSGDFLQGVVSGDFDGDGQLEVVLSWHIGVNVEMYNVPADPTTDWAGSTVISTQSQNEELSRADIDGDGDLDIWQGTRVLLNNGSGVFTTLQVSELTPPDRSKLVDMDGDEDLDAVVGFEGVKTDLVWLKNPLPALPVTTPWPATTIAAGVGGGFSLDVADPDRDGDPDVLLGEHKGQTRLLLFENLGAGSKWSQIVIHPGGAGFDHHDASLFADMDGDGDLDIVSGGWVNDKLVWLWENLAIAGTTQNSPSTSVGSATSDQRKPAVPAPTQPPTGLVAHWTMDRIVKGRVLDETGTSPGTPTAVSEVAGVHNGALRFSSRASGVNVGRFNVAGSALTIAAYFRADSWLADAGDNRIISKAADKNAHTWMLSGRRSGAAEYLRARIDTSNTDGAYTMRGTKKAITPGWHHAAMVYNGATLKLYLDSVEVGSEAVTGTIDQTSQVVWLGRNPDGKPFDGDLDDIRIYASALTPEQIVMLQH